MAITDRWWRAEAGWGLCLWSGWISILQGRLRHQSLRCPALEDRTGQPADRLDRRVVSPAATSPYINTHQLITGRGSEGQYCFRQNFVFSVPTITHEPLHLAWWSFAWTLTTARNPENFRVVGQRSKAFFRWWTSSPNNAAFRLSIARSVSEIFAAKV